MSSVASRVVRSSPHRDTSATWDLIMELLTQGENDSAKKELAAIAGIASSIIGDHAPEGAAIVASGDGPRTRIYCLYDEDALDGSDAKESALSYEPLQGDWKLSLPCTSEDLAWVQSALKAKSTRVTARDLADKLGGDADGKENNASKALNLDMGAFLKS